MKFVNKTFVGVITALALVVILCQPRFFNILLDTALGRIMLISLIVGISCTHKILGVISVLFIIIIYNQSNLRVYEGFNDRKKKENDETTTAVTSAVSMSIEPFVGGREGFNITEREGSILRGKRSSQVPIFDTTRKQETNVEPADKSTLYGELFTSV